MTEATSDYWSLVNRLRRRAGPKHDPMAETDISTEAADIIEQLEYQLNKLTSQHDEDRSMKQKTLKFTHQELALVTEGLARWWGSGEQSAEQWEATTPLLARLRGQLGDMNYDARQAGQPVFTIDP